MRFFRYAGRKYKLAAHPKTSEASAGAEELLKRFGLTYGELTPTEEGDGVDVSCEVALPNTLKAITTFDFNLQGDKPKLQEVVAEICKVGYVGNTAVNMQSLLKALQVLSTLKTPSGMLNLTGRQQKKLVQSINWLETYLPPILAKLESVAGKMDLSNRMEVVAALQKATLPAQGGKADALGDPTVAKQAVTMLEKVVDDASWASLVSFMVNPRGRHTPPLKLVQDKVKALTKHEAYSGSVDILGYEKDRVVVKLDAPAPFEVILLVFKRDPGSPNTLQLVTSGIAMCGGKAMETGPNEKLFMQLISAVVDMVLLSQNAANPAYSPPPEADLSGEEPAFSKEQYLAARAKYIFALQFTGDQYRFELKGKPGIDASGSYGKCMSKAEYEKLLAEPDSNLHKTLDATDLGKQVYTILPDGRVYQVNSKTGEPLDQLAYQIERKLTETCS